MASHVSWSSCRPSAERRQAGWILRAVALHDGLLESVEIARIVVSLPETRPINGWHDLALLIDALPTAGETAAQIIEWIRLGRPAPVPGNERGIAAAPQAETVGHSPALAHRPAVLDLARVMVRVAPILEPVLRDDSLVGHRIRLRTPDIEIGRVIGRVRSDRILGRVGPQPAALTAA